MDILTCQYDTLLFVRRNIWINANTDKPIEKFLNIAGKYKTASCVIEVT